MSTACMTPEKFDQILDQCNLRPEDAEVVRRRILPHLDDAPRRAFTTDDVEACARRLCREDDIDEDETLELGPNTTVVAWTEYTGRAFVVLDEFTNEWPAAHSADDAEARLSTLVTSIETVLAPEGMHTQYCQTQPKYRFRYPGGRDICDCWLGRIRSALATAQS